MVWWSLLLLCPLSLSSWSLFSLSLSLSSSPLVLCPIWQVVLWRLTLNSIFVAREPRKADNRKCQTRVFHVFPDIHIHINIETSVYPDIHININIETHVYPYYIIGSLPKTANIEIFIIHIFSKMSIYPS